MKIQLKSSVEGLGGQLSVTAMLVSELEVDVVNVCAEVRRQYADDDVQRKVAIDRERDVESKLAQSDAQASEMRKSITVLEADVTRLQGEVERLEQQAAEYEDKLAAAQEQVRESEAQARGPEGRVKELEEEVERLEQQAAEYEDKLAAAQEQVREIDALSGNRMKELEEEMCLLQVLPLCIVFDIS